MAVVRTEAEDRSLRQRGVIGRLDQWARRIVDARRRRASRRRAERNQALLDAARKRDGLPNED
jgi:hypothetical protein